MDDDNTTLRMELNANTRGNLRSKPGQRRSPPVPFLVDANNYAPKRTWIHTSSRCPARDEMTPPQLRVPRGTLSARYRGRCWGNRLRTYGNTSRENNKLIEPAKSFRFSRQQKSHISHINGKRYPHPSVFRTEGGVGLVPRLSGFVKCPRRFETGRRLTPFYYISLPSNS